jgi:hypothetical protein
MLAAQIHGLLESYLLQEGCNSFLLFFTAFKYIGLAFLSFLREFLRILIRNSVGFYGMEIMEMLLIKAKVSWTDICFPKKEGGLGLKDVEIWNISFMMRHIWSIFAQSGSIWVAWDQKYLLKGKSFWCVSVPNNSSWC